MSVYSVNQTPYIAYANCSHAEHLTVFAFKPNYLESNYKLLIDVDSFHSVWLHVWCSIIFFKFPPIVGSYYKSYWTKWPNSWNQCDRIRNVGLSNFCSTEIITLARNCIAKAHVFRSLPLQRRWFRQWKDFKMQKLAHQFSESVANCMHNKRCFSVLQRFSKTKQ